MQLSGNLRQMNEKITIALPSSAAAGRATARVGENRADEMLLRSRISQVSQRMRARGLGWTRRASRAPARFFGPVYLD